MTFGSPLLLASLVVPVAGAPRLPLDRAEAAAGGGLVPEPRRARLGLGPVELEAPPRRRAAAQRARAPLRRRCAPAHPARGARRSRHRRARRRRLRLDERHGRGAEPARGGRAAIARSSTSVPGRVKVGLVAFSDDPVVVTSPTTDRELLQARDRVAVSRIRDGDRRRRRPRRRARAALDRRGRRATATLPAKERPGCGRAALRRRADPRRAEPYEGARPRAAGGHPGLHDRARHPRRDRDDQPRRHELVVPVPPDRPTLARIAEATGGIDVRGDRCRRGLGSVYNSSVASSRQTSKPREVTAAFVAVAAALLAGAIGLAALWAPRLP